MKRPLFGLFVAGLLFAGLCSHCSVGAEDVRAKRPATAQKEAKATIRIDAAKVGEPISKYIYGQFIEHLGRLHLRRHLGRNARRSQVLLSGRQAANRPGKPSALRGAVSMDPRSSLRGRT